MSFAVNIERCVFFVGGNKAKSLNPAGSTYAGGCTKTWWNNQPNIDSTSGKQDAMAKLMGPDGEPIATTNYIISSGDGDRARLEWDSGNYFSDAEIGMLVYCTAVKNAPGNGAGIYKITAVDQYYIEIDEDYDSVQSGVAYTGGAWDDLQILNENYIDADTYTQEIFVNKDLAPTTQWDWSEWSGNASNNTWLKIIGFHRVPGDITESGETYFQSNRSMYENSPHPDKLVSIDMSGLAVNLISPDHTENISIQGFHLNNSDAGIALFDLSVTGWKHIEFEHCSLETSSYIASNKCRGLLFNDSCVNLNSNSTSYVFGGDRDTVLILINNYIEQNYLQVVANMVDGVIVNEGNVWNLAEASRAIDAVQERIVVSMNNTYLNYAYTSAFAIFRVHKQGGLISINDLVFNSIRGARIFVVAPLGGSFITKNLCAYSYAGQLTDLMRVDLSTAQVHDIDNLLEVDPQLDSNNSPRNKKVLLGGSKIGGQKTTLGAITQELQFVGRSTKSNPGRLGIIR